MRGIREGDVIILKEEETARCLWKLARIIEAIKGRDGTVQSTRIQLMRGDQTHSAFSATGGRQLTLTVLYY